MDGGFYGLNGWGIYDSIGWGMYDLNGWGNYGSNEWGSWLFVGGMLKNKTGLQGYRFWSSHDHTFRSL